MILRDMGASEGTEPHDKDTYITGLRNLILDLRQRKVRDLDTIAAEISAYRRQFLGDSSKTLRL